MDTHQIILSMEDVSVFYGSKAAIQHVTFPVYRHTITALIGPSGCGKSSLLKTLNRTARGASVQGKICFYGQDIYDPKLGDPIMIRKNIGMVFQKPNPFMKSIYNNVAYGLRLQGGFSKIQLDGKVKESLRMAGLWEEVKDDLGRSGMSLSGGQQQRLCIARAIALQPDIILMDEPCSALDPISTAVVEKSMMELAQSYTIVLVTHNMQQAQRVSDYTAFISMRNNATDRWGSLIEYGTTEQIFDNPHDPLTKDYISGRFG
jgi:phosphate transport system ATP-binding protein